MRNTVTDRPDGRSEGTGVAGPDAAPDERRGPERMRSAVADYVREVHAAYLRQARLLPPAVQGRLPLLDGAPLHVAAIGTRYLHLVATREALGGGSRGDVVTVDGEAGPIRWRLHYYDPVVVPGLGLVDERDGPAFAEVRAAIGLRTHLYHLTLRPPADLAAHHAGHTGTGLAGAHAAASRDFDTIRRSVGPDRTGLAEELEGACLAGLARAAGLVARQLVPGNPDVEAAAGPPSSGAPDLDALRRTVLAAVRPSPGGMGPNADSRLVDEVRR
jgi:hypothetical protein